MKIKPHLVFHILDSIEEWQMIASCWTLEREHVLTRRIGQYIDRNGHNYELGLLRRAIYTTINDKRYSILTRPTTLIGPTETPGAHDLLVQVIPDIGEHVEASTKMRTEYGSITKGDLILLANEANECAVGMAQFFARAARSDSSHIHLICFTPRRLCRSDANAANSPSDQSNASST